MLHHVRRRLSDWDACDRLEKLDIAQETALCALTKQARDDFLALGFLKPLLRELQKYNRFGEYEDAELTLAVARVLVNISSSQSCHKDFIDDRNRELHLRLLREPWQKLSPGEYIYPEGIKWVTHLAQLNYHEEARKLGLCMLCNLSTSKSIAEALFARKVMELLVSAVLNAEDTVSQRLAAACLWNLSKSDVILRAMRSSASDAKFLSACERRGTATKETSHDLASGDSCSSSNLWMDYVPSILLEIATTFEVDCSLGGDPTVALRVRLATNSAFVYSTVQFSSDGPALGLGAANLCQVSVSHTKNGQISKEVAQQRKSARQRMKAEREMKRLRDGLRKLPFDDLVQDPLLVQFVKENPSVERSVLEERLVKLLLSPAFSRVLGL